MKLYDYFRSAAAFRVRIALNLKGLAVERTFIHLRKGDQHSRYYDAVNPQHLVPSLDIGSAVLTESLAIIEYLNELYPDPPLLPTDAVERAQVRSIAQMVACDIHPVGNLRILSYLREELRQDETAVRAWYNHWVKVGLEAVERRLSHGSGARFCYGLRPTLADICLVPQVVTATRFGLDLAPFTQVRRVFDQALSIPAFAEAMPAAQPDAESA